MVGLWGKKLWTRTHPESSMKGRSTRKISGQQLQGKERAMNINEGGTHRWRSQGKGKQSKEYRKGKSAEDITRSLLGTLKIKCLYYFKTEVSKKRPTGLEFKKNILYRISLRMTGRRLLLISPGKRHKLSTSEENVIFEDCGDHTPWRGCSVSYAKYRERHTTKINQVCCPLLIDSRCLELTWTSAKENRNVNVVLDIF